MVFHSPSFPRKAGVFSARTGPALREVVGRRVGLGPCPAGARGFTLPETMIAVVIFSMVALGMIATLSESYKLAALSRARDEARAVLRTYVDQFERLQTTTAIGGVSYSRWLFTPTGGPTGEGLFWGVLNDADVHTTLLTDLSPLAITLGGAFAPLPATVTRDVRYVSASDGTSTASTTQVITAAGYLMQATFTVNFVLKGKTYTQSVSVVRCAP